MRPSLVLWLALAVAAPAEVLENAALRVELQPDASLRLTDKSTGAVWDLGAPRVSGAAVRPAGAITRSGGTLRYATAEGFTFDLRLAADNVEYSFSPEPGEREVLLFGDSLALGRGDANYYAVPHRMGILLSAAGEKPWSRRFRAYETGRGYSMAMFGAVKDGAALLVSWADPYTELVADYTATPAPRLSASLADAAQRACGAPPAARPRRLRRDLQGLPARRPRARLPQNPGRKDAREPARRALLRVRRFQAVRLHPQRAQHPLEPYGPGAPQHPLHLRRVRRSRRALQARPGHRPRPARGGRLGERRLRQPASRRAARRPRNRRQRGAGGLLPPRARAGLGIRAAR